MGRQCTAQRHAQHRAERAAGDKGGTQACPQVAREYRQHHGNADAAVGRLADAHAQACDKHLAEAVRQRAAQRRQAPQRCHQHQAPDPAPAVCQDRQRERQQADHQRHDAAQRTQLGVTQRPLGLQQREYRVQYLAGHVVRQQQAKAQGKDDPAVEAGLR
ncbi:hypothetical protein D3C72_1483400 [compost metagenome]